MAAQQFIILLLPQMQSVAFAVLERFTMGADAGFCP